MAAAFLPWEKWLGRLIHVVVIAIRRSAYKMRRAKDLSRSEKWTEAAGTVESIQWDSALPREEIAYSYDTHQGSQTGYHWIWFESPSERQPHVGDKIVIRYNEKELDESVVVRVC